MWNAVERLSSIFSMAEFAVAWNVVILSTGCGIALAINDRALDRALREVVSARRRADEVLERHREELESRFAERGRPLKASQAQLLENERLAAVGTLAAGIAHQINNPIGDRSRSDREQATPSPPV